MHAERRHPALPAAVRPRPHRLLPLLPLLLAAPPAAAAQLQHELVVEPQALQIAPGAAGLRLSLPGYRTVAAPGSTALPTRLIRLALPADADPTSVRLRVEDLRPPIRLQPTRDRLATGRPLRWLCRRCPPPPRPRAVDSTASLVLHAVGRAGPVPVVELIHRPLQPAPDASGLLLHRHQRLRLEFDTRPAPRQPGSARLVRSLVANPQRLPRPAPGDPPGGLAVVTSTALVAQSQVLADYVSAREEQGYSVHLVTEQDIGPAATAHDRALAIRAWLQANADALGLTNVLLLGNPDPLHGDVPMLATYPYGPEGWDYLDFIPSDAFYADLSGDWDLDGDGTFAEYGDDGGAGGVDFLAELAVGRIPVYGNIAAADALLERAIAYPRTRQHTGWRRRLLLPASILFFENQNQYGDPRLDGADIAELMKAEAIAADFAATSMYEHAGFRPSEYADDRPLTGENLIAEWNRGHGLVYWFGHGSEDGAFRTIWTADRDHDQVPDYSEMSSPAFAQSIHYDRLPAATPAFVFHGSCSNGTPENAANIAYTQLKTGAIAAYASTRVALGGGGQGWQPDVDAADVFTVGYFVMSKLRRGVTAGAALAETRGLLGDGWWGEYAWHTKLATSLYGDPTLSLSNCAADVECDDGLACNGRERCLAGICTGGQPVDCSGLDQACVRGRCSEPDGVCRAEALDGLGCDDGRFCTVGDACQQGVCRGAERSCAPAADACLIGICDERARACTTERKPDGTACALDDGEGECLAGVCQPLRRSGCSSAAGPGSSGGPAWLLLGWLIAGGRRRRRCGRVGGRESRCDSRGLWGYW